MYPNRSTQVPLEPDPESLQGYPATCWLLGPQLPLVKGFPTHRCRGQVEENCAGSVCLGASPDSVECSGSQKSKGRTSSLLKVPPFLTTPSLRHPPRLLCENQAPAVLPSKPLSSLDYSLLIQKVTLGRRTAQLPQPLAFGDFGLGFFTPGFKFYFHFGLVARLRENAGKLSRLCDGKMLPLKAARGLAGAGGDLESQLWGTDCPWIPGDDLVRANTKNRFTH